MSVYEYTAAMAGIIALKEPDDTKSSGLGQDEIADLRRLLDEKG